MCVCEVFFFSSKIPPMHLDVIQLQIMYLPFSLVFNKSNNIGHNHWVERVYVQPSLSLDNAVEVFLLKSEGEFISVEQGQKMGSGSGVGDKKKKREENMRQLLDVTNTITSEEMRDFEMRYTIQCKKNSFIVKSLFTLSYENVCILPFLFLSFH